jgi:hypothetical protein
LSTAIGELRRGARDSPAIRARLVALTPADERVLGQADAALERSRVGVLSLLGDDERPVFLSGLARLAFAHEGDLPACCASSDVLG